MDAPVFYSGGGFEVSGNLLKTPRKSYALAQIEYVSVQRPLLLFLAPPVAALSAFTVVFRHYLYPGEMVTLIGASALALALAFLFGTLRVHSLALRDDDVAMNFGLVWRLREVRAAVEQAMSARPGRRDAP